MDDKGQGRGVLVLDKASFDTKQVRLLGSGVFQDYVDQHHFFGEIMPTSVATLRMTSVLNDSGVVSLRACVLRVGRSADTHVVSSAQVQIPIDPKTGELAAK